MKVLVTGADGMLGRDLCAMLSAAGHDLVQAGRSLMDVTDECAVQRVIFEHKPQLVIHAAAYTNVDAAESNPDAAYRVNTIGTQNVGLACVQSKAQIILVSTGGVFDGSKGAPYTENDAPKPLTHYHRSKLGAERIIAKLVREHFILRVGWLFGGGARHRKNFVAQRYREACTADVLYSAIDRFGSPTYTMDFAEAAMEIVRSQAFGLYHVANSGFCSRHEYVSACIATLGLRTPVRPVTSDHFPRLAPVPAWEALDTYVLRLRGMPSLRPWQEALKDYAENRLLPEIEREHALQLSWVSPTRNPTCPRT